MFSLPSRGYVWFPISIFFGGLFFFVLPCCYCCFGWTPAMMARAVKRTICCKGKQPPALDEEEEASPRKSRSMPSLDIDNTIEQPIAIR